MYDTHTTIQLDLPICIPIRMNLCYQVSDVLKDNTPDQAGRINDKEAYRHIKRIESELSSQYCL